jgi:DNA invertase Pin-like site-specific DNA recombinase
MTKARSLQKPPKNKTAILYTRIASIGQNGIGNLSLQAQEEKLRNYCLKEKLDVVKVYYDIGSGHDFDRPQFQNFLKDLEMKKIGADFFLFDTIDRFGFDLLEVKQMDDRLRKLGITPKSIEPVTVTYIAIVELKK